MGAYCGSSEDKRFKRVEELKNSFPEFHIDKNNKYKYDKKDEIELIEHWKKFTSKKDELSKSNKRLFYYLFNRENANNTKFIYDGLKTDDEDKFYYFFNKRNFTDLTLTQSVLVFPRFSYQRFPHYRDENSTLKNITITGSKVIFDGLIQWYNYLCNLESLNLGYNYIDEIPEAFKYFSNLTYLNLRRNNLKNLPKTFEEMNNLIEIDLSENSFNICPKELFVKKEGEAKLKKLNMSTNKIQLFECPGLDCNTTLEFLFLSNNQLEKVPNDLKKYKNLKYVNLDNNLIKNTDGAYLPKELIISIKSQQFEFYKTAVNPIEEETKQENKEPKMRRAISSHSIKKQSSNENVSISKIIKINSSELKTDKSKELPLSLRASKKIDIKPDYENIPFYKYYVKEENNDGTKRVLSQLEIELKEKMNTLIPSIDKGEDYINFDNHDKEEEIKKKRFIFMTDQVEAAINNNNEKQLTLVEDKELKQIYRKCYGVYLKKKKFEMTGKLDNGFESLDPLEKEYFTELLYDGENKDNDLIKRKSKYIQEEKLDKYDKIKSKIEELGKNNITAQKEDISNLIFLKKLNSLITSHPIKCHLQYLKNIDKNIYNLLIELWEVEEKTELILILSEIKLFLAEMMQTYENAPKQEKFEVCKSQEKSIIHYIFFNELTLKILKCLGFKAVSKSIINGIEQSIFTFEIDSFMKSKYFYFHQFLDSFIQLFRNSNLEPMDIFYQ